MKVLLEKLLNGEDLTRGETKQVASSIFEGELTPAQSSAFLIALKTRGETYEEMAGFADIIKMKANSIPTKSTGLMDNCGTGGDRSFSFNISTTCAFVLSAAGINVAKHGNRSITSKSGSADVLESLGINLYLPSEKLAEVLDQAGIVFLFAQHLHPAMRFITPIRRELEIPTIMNLIGPLTHPQDLTYQLIGISRRDLIDKYALALKELGRQKAIVVSGASNLDEASLFGDNEFRLLENDQISSGNFKASDFGLKEATIEDIRGGEAQENADILLSVLNNEASPYLDTVLLNSAIGLWAGDKVKSIADGIDLARETISSGNALKKLQELQNLQK